MASSELGTTEATLNIGVRVVIQQCVNAKLQIQHPSTPDSKDEISVAIDKGILLYISFMKMATPELVRKAASLAANVKLTSDPTTSKKLSALEANCDILVVPQACLAAKIRGKSFQYHLQLEKEISSGMYKLFIDTLTEIMNISETKGTLQCGTYGIRQVLSIETNGPYTHLMDV